MLALADTVGGVSVKKDARRHHRVPYVGPIRLSWEDARGETRFAVGKCLDISESGIRIEAPAPLEVGARVMLNAERIKLSGSATVRRVERYGAKYLLGVELSQTPGEKTRAALNQPWALRNPAGVV